MICTPGFIWGQQGVEAYTWIVTGEGTTFQERKRTRGSCEECWGTMAASYLRQHMERSHGIVLPQVREVDIRGGGPEIYKVSLPRILKSVECPLERCPARAKKTGRLREHFMYQHWKSRVAIMQEEPEPFPRCDQCGIHIPEARLFKHRQLDKCHKATEIRLRRTDVDISER